MAEIFTFYRKQGIGIPVIPVVRIGEKVKRGQLIGEVEAGTLGARLHTSINGTVEEITQDAIFIEKAPTDYECYEKCSGSSIIEFVENAGLIGLGGAGFPTAVKLKTKLPESGVVIMNGAECEPILNHNVKRMEQEPKVFVRGLELAMEALNVKKGVVAIKSKHHRAVEQLEQAIAEWSVMHQDKEMRIVPLEDLYPMGEERAIIREVTGTILPTDALPSKANAVVINAETCLRIKEAVDDRKPLIDKDFTTAGKWKAGTDAKVWKDVPIGKPVSSMIEEGEGLDEEYGELIMGGPYTGKRISVGAAIEKTTGGILAAECFMQGPEKIGLLVCACGANEQRLTQIAASLGSKVCGVKYCKQAKEKNGTYKCENPGKCPGQAGKIIELKKQGAQGVLISNCTDCTNTVMSCAPALGLKVYHCTDGSLRAVHHKLIRKMKK